MAAMDVRSGPVRDPHVTIVRARTDGLNGVRWPFRPWDIRARPRGSRSNLVAAGRGCAHGSRVIDTPVTVTPYAASRAATGPSRSDFLGRRVPANQATSQDRLDPAPASRQ